MNVLFSCVAENRQDFATMVHNLVISIRAFAGELADAPIVANFVDGVDESFAAPLRAAGADVRVVQRVPGSNPLANKLRMLELADEYEFDVLVALDCDVVVVGDPSPWLDPAAISAKGADFDRFTDGEWRSLFAALGIEPPARMLTATATGQSMYPYFNSGVVVVPREQCAALRDSWNATYHELSELVLAHPEMLREQWRWLVEQSALAFAILRAGLPWRALPDEMNFPSHVPVRRGVPAGAPVIIHYHGDRDEQGFLIASLTDTVNPAIDRFNRRRAEVTGQPYTQLWRRPLAERLRRAAITRFGDTIGETTWYRSLPVTKARRQLKGAFRSLRRA